MRFVQDDASGSPYSLVRDLKRLASTITDGEHAADVLEIVGEDGRCAIQDGNSLSIDDVSSMLSRMRSDLISTLRSNILLGLQTPWLSDFLRNPNRKLVDDYRCNKVGYNFVSANPILKDHSQDLIKHLFATSFGQSHFIQGFGPDGNVLYNTCALFDFLQLADQCFLEFAKANHICSGEPMRGDEYSSLNIVNTPSGDRAFYWSQSQKSVFVWQTYVKTEGSGKAVTNILRLVAPDWLEIFLLLEVVVRPVLTHVAYLLWPEDNHVRAYRYKTSWLVRSGDYITGRQFGTSLANSFVDHVGFPVGLAQWRHWAAYFGDYVKRQHGCGGVNSPS